MNSFDKAKYLVKQRQQKEKRVTASQTIAKTNWKITKGFVASEYNTDLQIDDGIFALYFTKPKDIFRVAVMSGLTDVVRNLLEDDAVDIDIDGKYFPKGRTAIHIAAINNDLDTLIALTQKGADIYAKDDDGLTAKDYQKKMAKQS